MSAAVVQARAQLTEAVKLLKASSCSQGKVASCHVHLSLNEVVKGRCRYAEIFAISDHTCRVERTCAREMDAKIRRLLPVALRNGHAGCYAGSVYLRKPQLLNILMMQRIASSCIDWAHAGVGNFLPSFQ